MKKLYSATTGEFLNTWVDNLGVFMKEMSFELLSNANKREKRYHWLIENIDSYKKGDIINRANGQIWTVVKIYKYNWLYKVLRFLGIKVITSNGIKVKHIN